MRSYLLAAAAAAAIATPALARDGSPYVGIEAGVMIVEDLPLDVTDGTVTFDNGLNLDFKPSLDADVIAGYDFGVFRLEGELGYKRLNVDEATISTALAADLGVPAGQFDVDSKGRVLSLMANGLFDIGGEDGWAGYVGGGIGRARVKIAGDRDSAFAWQAIAGVRKSISENVDLGLKYRYFRTGNLNFNDDDFGTVAKGKLRTHSLLASLIFNFGAPAPVIVEPVVAPPPPPPPPATQTCYDGSVILATDVCPQPPVETPPPPPPAVPERG